MRNILQYPITDGERKETLMRVSEDILAEETIGDLRALIVQDAATDVDRRIELEKINQKLIDGLNQISGTVTDDADALRDIAENTLRYALKNLIDK